MNGHVAWREAYDGHVSAKLCQAAISDMASTSSTLAHVAQAAGDQQVRAAASLLHSFAC